MQKNLHKQYHNFSLIIILFMALFISLSAVGQDILSNYKQQYSTVKKGTTESFEIAGKYAQALFFHDQQENALELLKQNIALSKEKGNSKYTAYLYCILAMNYRIEENIDAANESIQQAQKYADRTDDLEIKGYVNYCIGWLNTRNNKEAQAVQNFINAVKLLEQAPSSSSKLSRLSATYKELTSIYANWNDFELQEKYSKLTLELAIKQKNANAIFDAYMMMGYLYEVQFVQKPSNIELRNLAEKYYKLAIDTYENNKDTIASASNLSFVANNLANLYLHYYPQSERNKVKEYTKLAKEIAEQTGQINHLASSYGIMAELAIEENDNEQAKSYLLTALMKVKSSNLVDNNILLSIYESLTRISEREKNYYDALQFHKLYMETYSTIYDHEKMEISKRLESQFEKEQQKQQLRTLKLESEKKEQQIKLMQSLGIQQKQELENLKLSEDNQRKKLEVSELQAHKHEQALQLSQLENKTKLLDIQNYKKEITYKEKLNKYFIAVSIGFALLIITLLYLFKQRNKSMKQKEELYSLELEQERQKTKISTLTALLEGQEQERARLARDLHDGLGGLLSGTKIQLTNLNSKINDSSKEEMKKSIAYLDNAVDELRRVAHNLMPDLLVKYGLEEALKEYASRMSNPSLDIDVQFLSYTKKLNQDNQLLVYRIIQELVNNSIKHAHPSQIIIQFVEDENEYFITVEDDGKGFNIEKIKQSQSAGLHNIQSRVRFLKGELHIHSEENLGTSVEFHFPKK